jgi:hypothetical protein
MVVVMAVVVAVEIQIFPLAFLFVTSVTIAGKKTFVAHLSSLDL